MNGPRRHELAGWTPHGRNAVSRKYRTGWLVLVFSLLVGCGRSAPPTTVEGTVRINGDPLPNCLVTFFPEPGQDTTGLYSTGLTDQQGFFRLRAENQQEGAAPGFHRVTVQDLSVSTGVRRRDHGLVDAAADPAEPPPPVRRSRVPGEYASPRETPLRLEVKPGHQVIDLRIKRKG